MKIASVKIKNFRGYGETDTEDGMYSFTHLQDTDIVIFTGYNGFGKTGFFEAIEWCITGKIKGLQEDNTERYGKPTMKNSSYLKFQCEAGSKEREVIVRVIFDNMWGITRKTRCNSLEELNYSDVVLDLEGHKVSQDEIDLTIEKYTGQKPEQILKLSFNGQNRNTDFVKSVKAKDRTGILLEFMGLKSISEIVERSDKNKNRKLKKACEEVESQYNRINSSIINIQQIFESNNWGKIEDYKSAVKSEMEVLDTIQEKLVNKGLMEEKMSLPSESLKDLLESLIKVKLLKEKLEDKIRINEKDIIKITKNRLIYKWKQIDYRIKQADLVKQVDIKSLKAEEKRLNQLIEIYQNSIHCLEDIIQAVGLETVVVEPITVAGTIGIAKEEKRQYERYLASFIKLQNIGEAFSVSKDYKYELYDIEKEYRRSQKYKDFYKNCELVINSEKQNVKELEGVYTEQAELLMQVQNYVTKQDNINSCPVCGGVDFAKDEQYRKEQLLNIISIKMSDGNVKLKTRNDNIVRQEKRLSVFRQKIDKTVKEKYKTNLNKLVEELLNLENGIKMICDRQISCNQISREKYRKRLTTVKSQISQFQEFMVDYKEDIGSVIQKNEQIKSKIETVLNTKFFMNNIDILEQEENKENDKIIPLFSIRKLVGNAMEYIDRITKYDVGAENVTILKEYEIQCEVLDKLKERMDLLKKAYDFREIINYNSKNLQNQFLSTMIEDNGMINWIYGRINPHPYFREIKLKIQSTKNQTDILSAERQNVYLDHIFSEAQMNVLSLSIFLGLVFSVHNYGFNQIFLDDPVQSLDDINEVSFIDLLRALIQSKEVDKSCIISTHDHNFSQLMKIKLRNYKFVEYRFESYGIEGPRIKMLVNNL